MPTDEERWKNEMEWRERDLAIRERAAETKAERRSKKKSEKKLTVWWTSPLILAVVAAAVAGFGNIFVAYLAARSEFGLESSKSKWANEIEELKAEASWILKAVSAEDSDQAARNLKLLVDVGLIKNEARRSQIVTYITTRPGGEGALIGSGQTSAVLRPGVKPAAPSRELVPWQSGWVSGGHNQAEMCNRALLELEQKSGGSLAFIRSDETSKKDWLGQVTYNYYCEFLVDRT
jgi:hypothetical protein